MIGFEPRTGRSPGAGTLWGAHLRRSPFPTWLAALVAVLACAVPAWTLLGGGRLGAGVLGGLLVPAGVANLLAVLKARARVQGELRESARHLETTTYEVQRVHRELEREQEEKARYHRRLRLLSRAVERMSLGLTVTDAEGRIVYVNPADAVMHGYLPEELLGKPSSVYGAPELETQPPEAMACWRRETINLLKDGRPFPVRLVSDAVLDESGRLQGMVTICEDISEERRTQETIAAAQEALAAREADYRQLVEGASDLIQSVDLGGGFRFVNQAWLEALGYAPDDLRTLTMWDIIHPAHHGPCGEVLARILREGRAERVETIFRARSGAEIFVEGNVGVRVEEGKAVATIGIFRDVSERRRVERMKQDFLATVSHELRTPLTSMLGSLGLVRGPRLSAQPEKARELLEIAHRNGDRLLRLINDLLDLQRLDAGELRFQITSVRLGPLLEEAVHDIQGFAELYSVRVRTETADPAAVVLADRDRLAQIFYNLLSNAIKFSPAGEEVVLAARSDGERVELSVSDRGPGIPEEFRARLFEKFAQADSSPARRRGGSGLGLSISRKIVEYLGGVIAIDSGPEKGTTVKVWLPSRPAQPAESPARAVRV